MSNRLRLLCLIVLVLPTLAGATTYCHFLADGSPAVAMTQGQRLGWEFDCTPLSSTQVSLWIDINEDGTPDPGDYMLASFTMRDQDTVGTGGPFDQDPTPGNLRTEVGPMGLAPAVWLMQIISAEAETLTAILQIAPLPTPFAHLSGEIVIPGIEPPDPFLANRFISTRTDPPLWSALTDEYGAFSINIPESGVYSLIADNLVPGYGAPGPIDGIPVAGDTSGFELTYRLLGAYICGTAFDDAGNPMSMPIPVNAMSDSGRFTGVISAGHYCIAVEPGRYTVQADPSMTLGRWMLPLTWDTTLYVHEAETLTLDLVFYNLDAYVYARVTEDGAVPSNIYQIIALHSPEGISMGWTDGSGIAVIPVSMILDSFLLFIQDLPAGWRATPPGFYGGVVGDTILIPLIRDVPPDSGFYGTIRASMGEHPDFTTFPVHVDDNTTHWPINTRNADSTGYWIVDVPPGTYTVYPTSGEYLFSPSMYTGLAYTHGLVGPHDFTANRRSCAVTFVARGVDPAALAMGIFDLATGVWPEGYHASFNFNGTDTVAVQMLCDAGWALRLSAAVPGYAMDSAEVRFAIAAAMPRITVVIPFHYVGSPTCLLRGHLTDPTGLLLPLDGTLLIGDTATRGMTSYTILSGEARVVLYPGTYQAFPWPEDFYPGYMVQNFTTPSALITLADGDTVDHDFILYPTSDAIWVRIVEDGGEPTHPYHLIMATTEVFGYHETTAGFAAYPVWSDGDRNYMILVDESADDWPAGYALITPGMQLAEPGDTVTIMIGSSFARGRIVVDPRDARPNLARFTVSAHATRLPAWTREFQVDSAGNWGGPAFVGDYTLKVANDLDYLATPPHREVTFTAGETLRVGDFLVNYAHCRVYITLEAPPADVVADTLMLLSEGAEVYRTDLPITPGNVNYDVRVCEGIWRIPAPAVTGLIASPPETLLSVIEELTEARVTFHYGTSVAQRAEITYVVSWRPNPTTDRAEWVIPAGAGQVVELRLVDELGRQIRYARAASGSDGVVRWVVDGLPGGVFHAVATVNGRVIATGRLCRE